MRWIALSVKAQQLRQSRHRQSERWDLALMEEVFQSTLSVFTHWNLPNVTDLYLSKIIIVNFPSYSLHFAYANSTFSFSSIPPLQFHSFTVLHSSIPQILPVSTDSIYLISLTVQITYLQLHCLHFSCSTVFWLTLLFSVSVTLYIFNQNLYKVGKTSMVMHQ